MAKNICAWKDSVAGFFNQCAFVKLKGQKSELGINIVHRSPNSSSDNYASLCEMIREMQGDYVPVGVAGLTTLYERRKLGDLVKAFKTLAGKNNVVKEIWFQIASDEDSTEHPFEYKCKRRQGGKTI